MAVKTYNSVNDFMEQNGFNAEGITYMVFGDNTYSIKDMLKESGFRYNNLLKWHTPVKIELPEGYQYVAFNFNDLYVWYQDSGLAFVKEGAEKLVMDTLNQAYPHSDTEYIGTLKERLRNLTVTFGGKHGFNGAYGYTNVYTFFHAKNVLVWFTQKDLNFKEGQPLNFTGTVVDFNEYHGDKTTKVNRCIVTAIDT